MFMITHPITGYAESERNIFDERLALYKKTETVSQIPWYYFAAIDQYERNTKTNQTNEDLISITFSPEEWFGIGNKDQLLTEEMIALFNGIGRDGNGDLKADPDDPEDVLINRRKIIPRNLRHCFRFFIK